MAFTRTISGISNEYLFHEVDYVVYVEGGNDNFTKEQIERGDSSEDSIDILFWENIFLKFKKNSKFKFKAIGSKTNVLKYAKVIVENDIATVYAAMDKEFDEVLRKIQKHKNILYTYGYSWENDVWNEALFLTLLNDLSAKKIDEDQLLKPLRKFLLDIKFSVYADAYLFSKSNSFIPRPGHMKFLECNINKTTKLKKDVISILVLQKRLNKSTIYSFGSKNKLVPAKNCYGHMLADFYIHLLRHFLKVEFNLISIGNEIIRRLVINRFIDNLNQEVLNHHKSQLN